MLQLRESFFTLKISDVKKAHSNPADRALAKPNDPTTWSDTKETLNNLYDLLITPKP